jgi:hypothetical protein
LPVRIDTGDDERTFSWRRLPTASSLERLLVICACSVLPPLDVFIKLDSGSVIDQRMDKHDDLRTMEELVALWNAMNLTGDRQPRRKPAPSLIMSTPVTTNMSSTGTIAITMPTG